MDFQMHLFNHLCFNTSFSISSQF